jgi:Excalibur calcium-binding domain
MERQAAIVASAVLFASLLASAALPQQFSCVPKKTCPDMNTCAEAYFQFSQCGNFERDRDNDGIPCEDLCGDSLEMMNVRLKAQSGSGADSPSSSLTAESFVCGAKKTCKQMVSCDEAIFQLKSCGNKKLDRDGDGVPCNALCR